jgi:hypothetical protein
MFENSLLQRLFGNMSVWEGGACVNKVEAKLRNMKFYFCSSPNIIRVVEWSEWVERSGAEHETRSANRGSAGGVRWENLKLKRPFEDLSFGENVMCDWILNK